MHQGKQAYVLLLTILAHGFDYQPLSIIKREVHKRRIVHLGALLLGQFSGKLIISLLCQLFCGIVVRRKNIVRLPQSGLRIARRIDAHSIFGHYLSDLSALCCRHLVRTHLTRTKRNLGACRLIECEGPDFAVAPYSKGLDEIPHRPPMTPGNAAAASGR